MATYYWINDHDHPLAKHCTHPHPDTSMSVGVGKRLSAQLSGGWKRLDMSKRSSMRVKP